MNTSELLAELRDLPRKSAELFEAVRASIRAIQRILASFQKTSPTFQQRCRGLAYAELLLRVIWRFVQPLAYRVRFRAALIARTSVFFHSSKVDGRNLP